MTFYPATDEDRQKMLNAIGVGSFEELVSNIPDEVRFKGKLNLPPKLSEYEVLKELQQLAAKNIAAPMPVFMGAGSYDHYVPAVVQSVILRSEFLTAYTPYQAEVSQGTLQTIYEYQTMMCQLTGMDVSNASMYDGGSSLAEACLLAAGHTQRSEIIIAGKIHPDYLEVVKTYCHGQDIKIIEVSQVDGVANIAELKKKITEHTAAVVVQHPNFYGCLEDVRAIGEIAKTNDALYIAVFNPISLGILEPPGKFGADIAVGEGQPLGVGLNFGGPYLGIFTVKEKLIRRIPGRLSGVTIDTDGKRGFVLTLQTREQQIRRERATSNICTNQGLMMLAACVYLSLLGKQGIQDVAHLCLQNSHYLADRISQIKGCSLKYDKPFFNEFVVTLPRHAAEIAQSMAEKSILAGIPLSKWGENENALLVAVTEKRSKKEMDNYVEGLKKSVK